MRVWGRPVDTAKWGTSTIASNSTLVPYVNRNEDLRIRMRMGDVFDDYATPSTHVVLFHYMDPETAPVGPRFYEENIANPPCAARWNDGGWTWLADNGGWWNGTNNGYRPYRYPEIRDDIYLPWMSHDWYTWETTLFARNNEDTAANYVIQHTVYNSTGGDGGAINNLTYRRLDQGLANDLYELPTYTLQPGNDFRGGWGVAADTGDVGVVYVEGGAPDRAQTYIGVTPFSNDLDLAAASTLYMPVFFWSQGGTGYYSKIFVQNAGSAQTTITAYYYGDPEPPNYPNGRTCWHTVGTLQPWGSTITHPEFCGWVGNPPASGSVRLTASQPLAAITHEMINWARIDGFNAFSQGSTTVYAPLALRNWYNWSTTLHIQNASSSAANVTVSYYPPGGRTTPICTDSRTLAAYRHVAIDLGDTTYPYDTCMWNKGYTIFSAVISANQPVAAVVNAVSTASSYFQAYNALNAGRTALIAPFVRKGQSGDWDGNWAFSLTIQNTTAANNTVEVSFYEQDGDPVSASPNSCSLGPFGSCVLYNVTTPASFSGSAVLSSESGSFAAVISVSRTDLAEGATSYSAAE
jgi:hypothetical protein